MRILLTILTFGLAAPALAANAAEIDCAADQLTYEIRFTQAESATVDGYRFFKAQTELLLDTMGPLLEDAAGKISAQVGPFAPTETADVSAKSYRLFEGETLLSERSNTLVIQALPCPGAPTLEELARRVAALERRADEVDALHAALGETLREARP